MNLFKDGYELKSGGNIIITYDGQGGSMVAIAEADKKDDGWYQCTATNPVGSAATRARLQVVMPKEIPSAPIMSQLRLPYPGRTIVPEYENSFFIVFVLFFVAFSLYLTINA